MTTPADDEQPEGAEPADIHLAFDTPFGVFTEIDDLPPVVRDFLKANLASLSMPDVLREKLAEVLEIDLAAEVGETAVDEEPEAVSATEHHRQRLWRMLDVAFPTEPHLWRAAESLFTLSAVNPDQPDDEAGREAVLTAVRHLEHHAGLALSRLSPTEQLVSEFRDQMTDL